KPNFIFLKYNKKRTHAIIQSNFMIILLLFLILTSVFVAFAIQNNFGVDLTLANLKFTGISFPLIILISLAAGFLLALITSAIDYFLALFKLRRLDREYSEVNKGYNQIVKRLLALETEMDKIRKAKNIKTVSEDDSL
ncbi:MAG: hypothetical protein UW37_C0005G0026, partial [Candidatus Gottesmanbacteria bacterium GW2011_GWA2_44_17]